VPKNTAPEIGMKKENVGGDGERRRNGGWKQAVEEKEPQNAWGISQREKGKTFKSKGSLSLKGDQGFLSKCGIIE